MMIGRMLFLAAAVGCCAFEDQVWTYTGPTMQKWWGDSSIRPPGLGDHFVIKITFHTPPPVGTFDADYNDFSFLNPTVEWSDGTVQVSPLGLNPIIGGSSFAFYDQNTGLPIIGLIGITGGGPIVFTTGSGQGPDAVIVCENGWDACNPGYAEQAAPNATPGTWTITNTPESGTAALFGVGAAALLAARLLLN